MPRYVWTTTYHSNDGPDGGEDLGIFTSKRKAVNEVREHAGIPKGSRQLTWEPVVFKDGQEPTLFSAEVTTEVGVNVYDEPIEETVRYYVQRRVVF